MYVLRNRSGIRLSYWIGKAEGGQVAAVSVAHGEDSPLEVEPELQVVSVPDTSQSIKARTICVQFEGAWAPLTRVIVDKVILPCGARCFPNVVTSHDSACVSCSLGHPPSNCLHPASPS